MINQDNIWLAISVVVLAIVAGGWLLRRAKLRRARSWPTTAGRVESSVMRLQSRGNNQSIWVAEVQYSYTVDGGSSSGSLRRTFLLNKSAEKWIANYPNGRPVTIRYNPNKTNDSVLDERDQIEQRDVAAS